MKSGQKVGNYILEDRIGEGGTGEVWRARHQLLESHVAIKFVFPNLARDAGFQGRFLQEARAMARLVHPHIVSVHDFFSDKDSAYLVMSYVGGGSLEDRLAEVAPLPIDETMRVSREVLSALDFAHQQQVVHRDVKPSNILLGSNGHACLADFGIALMMGKKRMTKTGVALGTPDYMSPEQIKGLTTIDHRTDVYSYGCVLYEALSGDPPFGSTGDTTTDFEIMAAHVNEDPLPLRQRNSQVDAAVEAVVMKALQKDPDKRFGGCNEMALALSPLSTDSTATPACPRCGKPVRPSARFCKSCGAGLAETSHDQCTACGNPLRRAAQFCNQCGHARSA